MDPRPILRSTERRDFNHLKPANSPANQLPTLSKIIAGLVSAENLGASTIMSRSDRGSSYQVGYARTGEERTKLHDPVQGGEQAAASRLARLPPLHGQGTGYGTGL
jgi:hypothetical protein